MLISIINLQKVFFNVNKNFEKVKKQAEERISQIIVVVMLSFRWRNRLAKKGGIQQQTQYKIKHRLIFGSLIAR